MPVKNIRKLLCATAGIALMLVSVSMISGLGGVCLLCMEFQFNLKHVVKSLYYGSLAVFLACCGVFLCWYGQEVKPALKPRFMKMMPGRDSPTYCRYKKLYPKYLFVSIIGTLIWWIIGTYMFDVLNWSAFIWIPIISVVWHFARFVVEWLWVFK